MENMNSIEQEINRKKWYIEIHERNIAKYKLCVERNKEAIEEIEKCKCLKDLRDCNNIYAYNWEKYICYDIWEWSIDYIHEFDTFEELKEHAKWYYETRMKSNNNEIKQSTEMIEKIKADIDRLKKILVGMVNNI